MRRLALIEEAKEDFRLSQDTHVIVSCTGVIPDYVHPPSSSHAPSHAPGHRPETMSQHSLLLSELCSRLLHPGQLPWCMCEHEKFYLYGKAAVFQDYPSLQGLVPDAPQFLPADACEPHSCLLYTSPSPRDRTRSRMPSSA
eukprot:TRINITY_DN34406_c0_g1_i1.p1 TRINITY_DN34406_c0_g1~~TRINITY_DN34406_c0_g1_i1.p1  ORF type:complete len:141 (+),score=29.76 TRINITY_DN34406_c0_g1_i1:107-529(+)